MRNLVLYGLMQSSVNRTRGGDQDMTTIGMVLFPNLTQLDLTGPYEVFCRMPDTRVHLVAATREPVATEYGLTRPWLPEIIIDP